MKQQWAEFLKSLPQPVKFIHRDEFRTAYSALRDTKFPALFIMRNNTPTLALEAYRINQARTIEDLIAMTRETLSHYGVPKYTHS
jgi:hypothetical protein